MTTERTGVGRTTLSMLAAEAGVSLSTISKVLNGRADVSPDTRQRVEGLLETHSYRRRGSTVRESTLLELVFQDQDLTTAWATEIITGVQEVARANGLSVVLTTTEDHHSPGPEWLSGVLTRRPAGVLVVASQLAPLLRRRLAARSIPFVVIDPSGDPVSGIASVGSTNWSGGVAATRHLIELGHTRIAAITGPEDMLCSFARLDGLRSAMIAAGLPVREDWLLMGDFTVLGGRLGADRLFTGEDRPTAVFAGSDLQALGVIEVLSERGLRVPDDVSVVGYDDVAPAQWSRPRLTTVHQPIRRMAAEAARIALRLSAGEPVEQQRLELAVHLVVRDSTAPPAEVRLAS